MPLQLKDERGKTYNLMPHLYIALGSNLGERANHLVSAKEKIEKALGTVKKMSHLYETKPEGFVSDNYFLNAVLSVETDKSAAEALVLTQQIERDMGRTEKSKNGCYKDRIIDIDLLYMEGVEVDSSTLTLPHPHLAERDFVLDPFAEIEPELIIPSYGISVSEMRYQHYAQHISRVTSIEVSEKLVDDLNRLLPQLSSAAQLLTYDHLKAMVKNDYLHLYVMRNEQNAVFATLTLSITYQLTGKKAWVEDVVIDKAMRGRGYGHQFLRFAECEAQRLGLSSLNLTSKPTRYAANNLYSSLGYKLRQTNVYRFAFPASK